MIHVTEILDYMTEPELLNWYLNKGKTACKKISQEALKIGSTVDQFIQDEFNKKEIIIPKGDLPIENCIKAWESFKKDFPLFFNDIINIQPEFIDYQKEIVGHPDFVLANGIVDLKCSSSIRPKYWIQTAQYLHMSGIKPPYFIAILRLDKESSNYEWIKMDNQDFIQEQIKVFNAYLTCYKHAFNTREVLRQQLEREVLHVS